MHRVEMEQSLVEICSTVLEHPVMMTVARANDPAWDSLRHMNLVLALEEAFGIAFTPEQTVEILNFPLIKEVLKEHGVEF